ncbi:pentapeptide repeat-containing protein, partial [Kitasatospora sp. NPDC004240]
MRHDLVLGLADDQREGQEDDERGDAAQQRVEQVHAPSPSVFSGAVFSGAVLSGAVFSGAAVSGAAFSGSSGTAAPSPEVGPADFSRFSSASLAAPDSSAPCAGTGLCQGASADRVRAGAARSGRVAAAVPSGAAGPSAAGSAAGAAAWLTDPASTERVRRGRSARTAGAPSAPAAP